MPNMSNNPEIHSVILNLNKNFSNNTGSNFKQIVNKQLMLKPNTLVALYSGSLTRQQIVIEEDINFMIEIQSQDPQPYLQVDLTDDTEAQAIENAVPARIEVTFPKGYYSKQGFAKKLVGNVNDQLKTATFKGIDIDDIVPKSGGNSLKLDINYNLFYEIKDGNFWLGLRRCEQDIPREGETAFYNRVSIEDLDDGCTTSNGITFLANYEADDNQLAFHSSDKHEDWEHFILGNNPIKGHCYSHLSDSDSSPQDCGWASVEVNLNPPSGDDGNPKFCFALHNTYFASAWNTGATTVTTSDLRTSTGNIAVPTVILGAYLDCNFTSGSTDRYRLTLYAIEKLWTDDFKFDSTVATRDDFMTQKLVVLGEYDLREYKVDPDLQNTFFWEIYAHRVASSNHHDDLAVIDETKRYYARFYVRSSEGSDDSLTLLYDSIDTGMFLNEQFVESGSLFQCIENPDDDTKLTTGGLCPQFYLNDAQSEFLVSNPKLNSQCVYRTLDDTFHYQANIINYAFDPLGNDLRNLTKTKANASLQNVLGVIQDQQAGARDYGNSFNANYYPKYKEMSGLTNLNTDYLRYNVELNLPVKAYNTTEQTTNDIGQTRTILYNTDCVEGSSKGLATGILNYNIEPNNLKYLSLNNPDPIKLNTLDIQIRRAKTNEIADEISDASLELLFYSEGNPHGGSPYHG